MVQPVVELVPIRALLKTKYKMMKKKEQKMTKWRRWPLWRKERAFKSNDVESKDPKRGKENKKDGKEDALQKAYQNILYDTCFNHQTKNKKHLCLIFD